MFTTNFLLFQKPTALIHKRIGVVVALSLFCFVVVGCGDIGEKTEKSKPVGPSHPKDLVYPEYVFDVPDADSFMETLDNGVRLFIVEDRELPLVRVTATFRGGKYLDPEDKAGLTNIMATLIRDGGTSTMTAEKLDETFAFLAANVDVRGGGTTITANLDCLESNFKECFELFFDMLQHPAFQESKVRVEKDNVIERMKQRNDYPSSILNREFSSKMFGDSYLGKQPVVESVSSVNKNSLSEQFDKIVDPTNLVLSVSGDFDRNQMVEFMNETVGQWGGESDIPNPPNITHNFKPGIYFVDKDVPQGGVKVGIRSVQQGDPDVEPLSVMNYILGGGGFSSRITQSIRSNEGLAYGAGSMFSAGPWGDGVWVAGFESKSSTVALATKLLFDEIERIKTEPVTDDELALAKKSLVEQFPSNFQSKAGTLGVFVRDTLTNRDPNYWKTYREKIKSVTAEDVMRVANRVLIPKKMVVVIVGDWDAIVDGDDGGRASMQDISSIVGGDIVELPMRDPLTLEVPNN
ncbi:MAG: pitrilysin family protein [Phycisphaerales bacterium]|jgi:zinc protease|nr:pitrilysin family protein [Phycisphaerales bacterium]